MQVTHRSGEQRFEVDALAEILLFVFGTLQCLNHVMEHGVVEDKVDIDTQSFAGKPIEQSYRRQAGAANHEEVVVARDVFCQRQFAPDRGQLLLQRVLSERLPVAAARQRALEAFGERLAVDLAVAAQGNLRQHLDGRRQHVARQTRGQVLTPLLDERGWIIAGFAHLHCGHQVQRLPAYQRDSAADTGQ